VRQQREDVRRVGLVVRVSTDIQASNPEGSLVTQLQRLRQQVAYKRDTIGEPWEEAAVYELRGISGKDSVRSPEFQRLFEDIEAGRVNTIICTALSRLCRSLRDFLDLLEVLEEHGVEFCSLKEQFDTTTPHGRLIMTILMALAQFEREQTSERTRDAVIARAERGLWNGGRLFGFDLDPDRKGYLIPNAAEVEGVRFLFEAYLECGSIKEAVERFNSAGYRGKSYTSRRGKHHAGGEFTFSTVQQMLKNVAYVGKREVQGADGPELVDAVWPAILDQDLFDRVQELKATNGKTGHNAAKRIKHVYVLSGGLTRCARCGGTMHGRSGTGRQGKEYFYYSCQQRCGLRVSADRLERAVLDRLRLLANDGETLDALAAETNRRLSRDLPKLRKQRETMTKQLAKVAATANKVLTEWSEVEAGRSFVEERLEQLSAQRDDLRGAIADLDRQIAEIETSGASAKAVREALGRVDEVYEHLKPHERKELFKLLLRSVEVGERQVVLEIYAGCASGGGEAPDRQRLRGRLGWLPGAVAHSVMVDRFRCVLPTRHARTRAAVRSVDTRTEWSEMLAEGVVRNRAELARRLGLSRARVTQILGPIDDRR
jgi:site-specific DNA recombinase